VKSLCALGLGGEPLSGVIRYVLDPEVTLRMDDFLLDMEFKSLDIGMASSWTNDTD
jgi:hypothetical protein